MFVRKTNSGKDKIYAGDELRSSMSTSEATQRVEAAMNDKKQRSK